MISSHMSDFQIIATYLQSWTQLNVVLYTNHRILYTYSMLKEYLRLLSEIIIDSHTGTRIF